MDFLQVQRRRNPYEEPAKSEIMSTGKEVENKLSSYYQQKVPPIQISNLEQMTEGWETEIYSFTAHEEGTSRELILRIYPGDDALQKSQREFNAMDQLHKMSYPVPEVFVLEVEPSFLGNPFVIMEKIDGTPMWPLLVEASGKEREEYIILFCSLFVHLHTLDWKPFAEDSFEKGPYAWINQFLKRAHQYIDNFKKSEFNPVLDWLDKRKATVPCEQLSVTHNDYHPHNVLVRNGKAFVIDWSSVAVEDFRMDVAWTLLLTSTYGNLEFRDVILSEYERIAGVKIKNIEYFDVLASLKRLFTISVSLTEGAETLGMRPGAEAMMKQNIAHIKRVHHLLRERTGIVLPEIEALISLE